MIRALIVDDEPIARRRIRRLLGAEPDVAIVRECGDGRAAVDAIRAERPDLVFLDVQMPEADGFAVIRAIGESMPAVVFVTAYDQYALGAFEVHALDYLLKPFNRKRFAQALARVRDHLARVAERRVDERLLGLLRELRAPRRHLARFVVRTEGRLRLIDADRVEWIEAADNYAVLHVGSASYTVRETMSRLAEELDPGKFVRIQRSAIVRIDRIAELLPAFHGDFVVVLQDGTRLSLTRVYRPQLEAALGRPL